jgi:hypothetical protein
MPRETKYADDVMVSARLPATIVKRLDKVSTSSKLAPTKTQIILMGIQRVLPEVEAAAEARKLEG